METNTHTPRKQRKQRKPRRGDRQITVLRPTEIIVNPGATVHIRSTMPKSTIVHLRFLYNGTLTVAGLQTASKQLRNNGAYDVDPSLASTAMPGFVEWMSFYSRYRVLATTSSGQIINREDFPLLFNHGYSSQFQSPNSIKSSMFENRLCKTVLLPQSGSGGGVRFYSHATMLNITGDVSVYTSDQWTGTAGANPNALNYVHCAIDSTQGASINTGAYLRWVLEMEIEFFEPKTLSS